MFFIDLDNFLDFSLADYKKFFKEVKMIETIGVDPAVEGIYDFDSFSSDYFDVENGVWVFENDEPVITIYGEFIPSLLIAYARKDGVEIDTGILSIDLDKFHDWLEFQPITPFSFNVLNRAINTHYNGDESEPALAIVSNSELSSFAEEFIISTNEDIFDKLEIGMKVRMKNKNMARRSLETWKNVRNIDDDLVYASRSGVIEGLYVQELGGMKLVKIKGFGWCVPVEMIEEVME